MIVARGFHVSSGVEVYAVRIAKAARSNVFLQTVPPSDSHTNAIQISHHPSTTDVDCASTIFDRSLIEPRTFHPSPNSRYTETLAFKSDEIVPATRQGNRREGNRKGGPTVRATGHTDAWMAAVI